jgi:NCS1 family nucleobase:cation symporter-1
MCPWKLLATPDAYIFGWLVGYSGLLGPVAGIMDAITSSSARPSWT